MHGAPNAHGCGIQMLYQLCRLLQLLALAASLFKGAASACSTL
jgi:hypothetical protein